MTADPDVSHEDLVMLFRTPEEGGILRPDEYRALGLAASQPEVGRRLRAEFRRRNDAAAAAATDARLNPEGFMHQRMAWLHRLGMADAAMELGPETHKHFLAIRDRFEKLTGKVLLDGRANQVLRGLIDLSIVRRARGEAPGLFKLRTWRSAANKPQAAAQWMLQRTEGMFDPTGIGAILTGVADRRLRATGNPWIVRIADALHIPAGSQEQAASFIGRKMQALSKFGQAVRGAHKTLDAGDVLLVGDVLRRARDPADVSKRVRRAADRTRALFQDMRQYLLDAGVELGDIGPDYYPMVFDANALELDRETFVELLTNADFDVQVRELMDRAGDRGDKRAFVKKLHAGLVEQGGLADGDGDELSGPGDRVFTPWFRFQNSRQLAFLWDGSDAARRHRGTVDAFLSHDHSAVLSTYVQSAVKRAEFTRAFGPKGSKLKTWMDNAKAAGATDREMELARNAVNASLGNLGAGWYDNIARWFGRPSPRGQVIDKRFNAAQSWMLVGLNAAFVPLATLSSMIDPIGIYVRTSDFNTAYHGWAQGMRSLARATKDLGASAAENVASPLRIRAGFRERRGRMSRLEEIAEAAGVADRESAVDAISAGHTSNQMTRGARRANDVFFTAIGLTGWTRITRRMATASGLHMLKRIAQGKIESKRAERFLREMDLTRAELDRAWDPQRERVRVLSSDGVNEELGTKVREALRRFVDESILYPNSSMRPVWMSNPWMAVPGYLKHYVYSFYDRIILRIAHEFKHRRVLPGGKGKDFDPGWAANTVVQASLYSGVMIAADMLRHAIQGVDDDDREDWNFGDWYMWGLYRAGMFGPAGVSFEIAQDREHGGTGYESVLGPAVEFLAADAPDMLSFGSEEAADAWLKAAPGSALHRNWDVWDD